MEWNAAALIDGCVHTNANTNAISLRHSILCFTVCVCECVSARNQGGEKYKKEWETRKNQVPNRCKSQLANEMGRDGEGNNPATMCYQSKWKKRKNGMKEKRLALALIIRSRNIK